MIITNTANEGKQFRETNVKTNIMHSTNPLENINHKIQSIIQTLTNKGCITSQHNTKHVCHFNTFKQTTPQ